MFFSKAFRLYVMVSRF